MSHLIPCPGCSRHLRRSESACPFCGADVRATMTVAPERTMPTSRLGRGALFAFAAATVGAVACGGSSDTNTGSNGIDKGDASTEDGSSGTGGVDGSGGLSSGDGGSAVALYGAPYFGGAGGMATAGTTGSGGEMAVPAYGAPFPTTGGSGNANTGGAPQGAAGFAALYGAVPAPDKP
ncbi:MAG TPA: hypothetical protein VHE30_11440 [Polyangiaceae bacterium]|nr:hypothetical protein [Polyangiaceae bacterium]